MNSPDVKTVLAVDDSRMMQTLIQQVLSSHYRVLCTDNALSALDLMAQEPISVLLLDISMPEIDGLELCRTVRSSPQFRHLPIVMLTARSGAFDRVQGWLAGATDYLTKPLNVAQLKHVIARVTACPPTAHGKEGVQEPFRNENSITWPLICKGAPLCAPTPTQISDLI